MNYGYEYTVLRWRYIPRTMLASIYADAASQLEAQPEYDDPLYAIQKATESRRLHNSVALYAWRYFADRWSSWLGGMPGDHNERILMLGFSSAMAKTGDF